MLHAIFDVLIEAGAWFAFVGFYGLITVLIIGAAVLLFGCAVWLLEKITGKEILKVSDEQREQILREGRPDRNGR